MVAGVTLHAWGTLPTWYAAAVSATLVVVWCLTAPLDKLMLTCLHPIGVCHAPKSLLASMDITVNDAVVANAKVHRDALLALVASGGARGAAQRRSDD